MKLKKITSGVEENNSTLNEDEEDNFGIVENNSILNEVEENNFWNPIQSIRSILDFCVQTSWS